MTKGFVKEDVQIKHLDSSKVHIILDLGRCAGILLEQRPQHKDISDNINLDPEFSE